MLLTLGPVLAVPLSTPGYACACGAAVAPSGANATMNREVALVHWDGTTETMVMQLAMDASTDNVALVVPTPAPAIAGAVHDPLLRELTNTHGGYLTKTQVDIYQTSAITSDFVFGNASNDDSYRQVIVIDDDVAIPVELVLLGVLVLTGLAVVLVLLLRRRRRRWSRTLG